MYTDCKALENILSPKKSLDNVINSRFLRWILFLQNYDLTIKFRSSQKNINADCMSRLPVTDEVTGIESNELQMCNFINMFNNPEDEPISREIIAFETQQNSVSKQIFNLIKSGWPENTKLPEYMRPFINVKLSLDIQDECIFYGDRVFIPHKLRKSVLRMLHKEHNGMVKTKQLARTSV